MLRSILRATAAASKPHLCNRNPSPILSLTSNYSAKTTKSTVKKAKKGKSKADAKAGDDSSASAAASDDLDAALSDDIPRARRLAAEENDTSLDVGPNGRPLFTSASSLSQLTRKDAGTYFKFNMEGLNKVLPEGLPLGMVKEFEESMRSAVLVRQSFLDLRDNFRRVVDPSLLSPAGSNIRKQIVLDGPVNCGKSIALAMLVQWARDEGWLVLYVPSGRRWTHGGFFFKNPQTGLWDTPVQAEDVLRDFLKYNETRLRQLTCQISEPIPLGEGVGVGMIKGADSMTMPEGSTLYDLIDTGIKHTHAKKKEPAEIELKTWGTVPLQKPKEVEVETLPLSQNLPLSPSSQSSNPLFTLYSTCRSRSGAQFNPIMNDDDACGVMEAQYIRRHHRHHPNDNQCTSAVFKNVRAPVPLVWSLVRRFDQPQKYKPFVSRCVVKGDLGIGSVREVNVKSGLPATTSTERLELLDDEEHILGIRIVGGDHRLKNYSSIMTVHPKVIDGRPGTLVIESFVVDVPNGNTKDETCYFVKALIRCNLKSLADVSERMAVQGQTEPLEK